jgi:putative hydrolase of the HAD superfamily
MIKNIIFDLGNVILNIDTNKSKEEFFKYGLKDFNQLYTLAAQSEIFDRLEIGVISPEEFFEEFRKITKTDLSNEIIRHCWNALILDYPKGRIKLLQTLKPRYRTFLLSNTNKIHYDFYTQDLVAEFDINGLESLFEKAYFSHEIGMKKPNPEIFKFVLNQSGLDPYETLFIDDNKHNVAAAEELGIKTIYLKDNNLEKLEIWESFLL